MKTLKQLEGDKENTNQFHGLSPKSFVELISGSDPNNPRFIYHNGKILANSAMESDSPDVTLLKSPFTVGGTTAATLKSDAENLIQDYQVSGVMAQDAIKASEGIGLEAKAKAIPYAIENLFKGGSSTAASMVASISQVPGIVNQTKQNNLFDDMAVANPEAANEALNAVELYFGREAYDSDIEFLNLDVLKNPDGSPISKEAKDILEQYKKAIASNRRVQTLADIKQDMLSGITSDEYTILDYKTKRDTLKAVSQMAGNVAVSYFMFGGSSLLPRMAGAAMATKATTAGYKALAPVLFNTGRYAGNAAVFSMSFLNQAVDIRNLAIAQGKDIRTANVIGAIAGTFEATVEMALGMKALNGILTADRSFRNLLFYSLQEGTEELIQSAGGDVITNVTGLTEKQFTEIATDAFVSFIGGALGSLAFAAGDAFGGQVEARRAALNYKDEQAMRNYPEPTPEQLADTGKILIPQVDMNKVNQQQQPAEATSTVNIPQVEMTQPMPKWQEARLADLKQDYVRKAKQINKNITEQQIDKGWQAVERMIRAESITNEFSVKVMDAMGQVLGQQAAASQGQQQLSKALSNAGINPTEQTEIINRLTSKDANEKFNAEVEIVEQSIIRDFAQIDPTGKQSAVFAKEFTNIMKDSLMLSNMSPLEYYQAIKPTVFSFPVAHITGQYKNPILSEIQFPAQQDIASARGKATETLTKIKLLADNGVDKDTEKMLSEVNMELYGNNNLSETTGLYSAIDSQASILANVMYSELGWHIGSNLTRDDFRVMSLLYSQGYEMAEIAQMFNLNTNGLDNVQANEAFDNALKKLYPRLTEEELNKVKDVAQLFNPAMQTVEEEFANTDKNISDTQQKKAKERQKELDEEYGVDTDTTLFDKVDTRDAKTKFVNKAINKNSDFSKYLNSKLEDIINHNISEVKGVYDKDTNTIIVRDLNSATGIHEMQHFLLSKVLFDRYELIASDKTANAIYGSGQIKKLAEMINDALPERINNKRITDIQKQETLVEAILDYTINGTTGVQEIDSILNAVSSDIKEVIHSPKGSLYNQMSNKAKNNLSTAIKNLFVKTTPSKMLDAALELEGMLFNSPTEEINAKALEMIDTFAIPEGDSYKAMLEFPKLTDYNYKLSMFQNIINDMRTQAVNLVLQENPLQAPTAPDTTSFYDSLTVDQVLKNTNDEKLLNAYSKIASFVDKLNPKRYDISKVGDIVHKAYSTWSWAKGLGVSLVDRANKVNPMLGEVFNRAQQKYNADTKNMLEPATKFSELVNKHFIREADQVSLKKAFWKKLKKKLYNSESRANIGDFLINEVGEKDGMAMFQQIIKMLDNLDKLYTDLVETYGLTNLTYINNFFPRSVIQSKRHIIDKKYMLAPSNRVTKILRERGSKNVSSQDADERVNKINGLAYAKNEHEAISLAHSRTIKFLDDDVLDAYEDPIESYTNYIKNANRTIMVRSLFGNQVRDNAENTIKNLTGENGEKNQSKTGEIGKILASLGYRDMRGLQKDFDEIYKQEQKASEDLDAFIVACERYLKRASSNNIIYDVTKSAITLTTITNYITALSQIQEIVTTGINYGFNFFQKKTFDALGAHLAEDKVTIDNLNLEPLNDILRDVTSSSLSNAVSIATKLSLFQYADTAMKNRTLEQIRIALVKMQKGEKGFRYERLMERCKNAFAYSGEKRMNAALKAIEEGKINEGGQAGEDAKYLIVSLFADQQPIDSMNVPEMYNGSNGFAKLSVFALQTVNIKQNSAMLSYINDAFHKSFGDGMKALLSYIFMSIIVGIPLDAVKNSLKLQPINIKNSMIYSPMQIFFLNEYDISVFSREGFGSMLSEKFAMPLRQLTSKGNGHGYKIMPVIGPGLYAIYNEVTGRSRALYKQLSEYQEDADDAIESLF